MSAIAAPLLHGATSLMHGAASIRFLADDTDTGDELHKAGPIAIVVIIVLAVASFFLFKSMSAQLRKVRENFPADDGDADGLATSNPPDAAVTAVRAPAATRPRPPATSKSRASAPPSDGGLSRRPNAGGPDRT